MAKEKKNKEEQKGNGELVEANEIISTYDNEIVRRAEMSLAAPDAITKIKRAALKVTNKHDWVNQNGKPYLQASGGEKVAGVFGINWSLDKAGPVLEVEPDGHYSYTYNGLFELGIRVIEVIGSRGTKDPFFSRAHGEDVPVSEIDRNDVKKAALTNMIGNGITRILGIRNLTWEDLKNAGINIDSVASIDYSKKELSEEAKDERKKIGIMILGMVNSDKKKAGDLLKEITTFTAKDGKEVPGRDSVSKLTEKQIPVVYGQVKKAHEKWINDKIPKGGID